VEGRGAASPLGPERCWIILLGGIVRVVFGIEQRWTPNVGIQVLRLEPPNTRGINAKVTNAEVWRTR
jgi:hypothetical protein